MLGWSHRTVASSVIRTDQERNLGCLFWSNWRWCCRYQMLLQWKLLSPLVRHLLTHCDIFFSMQAKIPHRLFFSYNKDSVLSVHVTPCSLHCGTWRGKDPSMSLLAERRGFFEDKNCTAKPPTATADYKLSAQGPFNSWTPALSTWFPTWFSPTCRD